MVWAIESNTVLDSYIEHFSALATVSSEGLTQSLHSLERRDVRRLIQDLKSAAQ